MFHSQPRKLAEPDQPVGEVGGDLVHVAVGPFLGFLQADPLALGLFLDGLLNDVRIEQLFEQQVAVGQLGAGSGQLLAAEVGAGDPRQLVGDGLVGAVLVRHVTQGERRGEAHQVLAPFQDHDQRLLEAIWRQAADDVPAGGLSPSRPGRGPRTG